VSLAIAPDVKVSAPVEASRKPVVLVVDDIDENREMLGCFLQGKGYEVLEAADGEAALKIVADRPLDLIVLDEMMPGLSGTQVLERVRRRFEPNRLPVIMATAKDGPDDVVRALALGANDYVVKPMDLTVLLARAETQLAVKRLTDELELKNDFIRTAFGRYLSHEVVASLLNRPEGLQLGGIQKTVTLLMCDLRGFTSLTAQLQPPQVVRLLNNYLGVMADVITRFQGTIDEFIGDAILALFGAPESRDDDAQRAVACAVAMQAAMASVNAQNRKDGLPEVQMGVAVNTGDVIVGNIGSHRRTKYGVVGTHVNLTSRIESFTLGGQVLVSEATLAAAGGSLKVGEKLSFRAKGFSEPVNVFEVKGLSGRWRLDVPERVRQLVTLRAPLPVHFQVLHGPRVLGESVEGELTKVSATTGELRARVAPPPHSEVKLRLLGPDGRETAADAYARVTSDPAPPDSFVISFTALPPSVRALLDAAQTAVTERRHH
jgi:adenylate cyclase